MNASTQTSSLSELLSHSEWLRVLARRLVADEAAADDLVQETWLAVMKNPPLADRPARPWLAGVLRNLAKLRFRTEARLRKRQEISAKGEGLPSAAQLVEQVETERNLASVVLGLDEPYRTAVLLHYFQDLSLAEIAKKQGVPAATVRWRHARGLELLREILSRESDDQNHWCFSLMALARVAPLREEALVAGGAITGTATWVAVSQVVAALLVTGLTIWAAYLSWVSLSDSFGSRPALVREHQGGPEGPDGSASFGSSLAEAVRHGADVELDPDVLSEDTEAIADLRVHLVDEAQGAIIAGRRMVALNEDMSCHFAQVDEEGWASFSGIERPVHLYVARPGGYAHARPLSLGEREVWVHLDAGEELSGQAHVGQQPAPAGIELTLINDQRPFGGRDWPDPVYEEIFRLLRQRVPAVCRTDSTGAFAFRGLPPKWTGVLSIPSGFVLGDEHPPVPHLHGGGEIRFVSARAGIDVWLEHPPRLEGRLLNSTSLTPVADALLRGDLESKSGKRILLEATSGEDGRFALFVPEPSFAALTLVFAAGADGAGETRVGPTEFSQSYSLGDLFLSEGALWPLVVEDELGEPVAGAVASASQLGPFSSPTDDEGRTSLLIPAVGLGTPSTLEVQAEGFGTAQVERPAGEARELNVTLRRAAVLEVEVELPPHVWNTGLRLVLESTGQPLFAGVHGSTNEDPMRFVQSFDMAGRLAVLDLRPHQDLSLSVLGAAGNLLTRQAVAPLQTGELRRLTVPLFVMTRKVHATVKDNLGIGLTNVSFEFFRGEQQVFHGTNDRKSAFRVDYLPLDGLRLVVSKRGFVSQEFDEHTLPGATNRFLITMQRARDLRLKLQNLDGSTVTASSCVAMASKSNRLWRGVLNGDGEIEFFDLPTDGMILTLDIAGRRYQRPLPSEIRSLTLEF